MPTPLPFDLTVIIPLYNEECALLSLFLALESQLDLSLEVVFSDGGSVDRSLDFVADYQQRSQHNVVLVTGQRGRARQMNRGAAKARAPLLLFLHADSQWHDPNMLSSAVCFFKQHNRERRSLCVGHFPLHFTPQTASNRFYRYLAAKSSLNRCGTIFGDQGLMIQDSAFEQLVGFDESLEILEDVDFAERVLQQGQWLLLPGLLVTSSRRYESEGVWRRQFRNALLLLIYGSGQLELLALAMTGYVEDPKQQVCDSCLASFSAELSRLPVLSYLRFWYGCGEAVASYLWVVPYRVSWSLGGDEQLGRRIVTFYDHWIAAAVNSTLAVMFISLGCWLLFYLSVLCQPVCWSWNFLRKNF